MSDQHPFEDTQRSLDRIIYFSDAIFAIAITLLALDIRLPQDTKSNDIFGAIFDERVQLVSFFISFTIVGMYWVVHHRIFRYIKRYDSKLIWLNLAMMLLIVLLPFPSSVLGTFGDTFGAVVLYAVFMTAVGVCTMLIFVHSTFNHRLTDPGIPKSYEALGFWRAALPPAVFLLSIAIAFISPIAAESSWLLIPVARVILSHIYKDFP